MSTIKSHFSRQKVTKVASAIAVALTVGNLQAADLGLSDGWNGSLDTTIAVGTAIRMEDQDSKRIGKSNNAPIIPGQGFMPEGSWSTNGDDGNLNFDKGDAISQALNITMELDLNYEDSYGLFVRANAWYDHVYEKNDMAFKDINPKAQNRLRNGARLLDAYVWGSWDMGEQFLQLRAGSQVINWGESTLIQHSISEANPIDVTRLRTPGAELREAFIPVDTLWGSWDINESWNLEAYVQFEWQPLRLDAPGTYFASNDFIGDGGEFIELGFGQLPELTTVAIRRGDQDPSDDGQYGVRLGWFSEELGETDFGFYYVNYHNKRPIISTYAHNGVQVEGFVEYLEDIQMYGFSFNTNVGESSLAGEISYRKDEPLQIDDVEILFAALEPVGGVPSGSSQLPGGSLPGDLISGYRLFDTIQAQMTLTTFLGPTWGADQFVILAEVGATWIQDMPSQDELRFDAPGTVRSGNPARAGNGIGFLAGPGAVCTSSGVLQCEGVETNSFGEDFSWGYRLIARLSYSNVFDGWNMSPTLVFSHDVDGTTPLPIGNFVEDRKSAGIAFVFDYNNQWVVSARYNMFFDGDANVIDDRDNIAFNASYSF